jgi:hypothetical protein
MSNNSIYATYIPYIPLIEYNIDYSELLNRQFKEDIQVLSESPYKGGILYGCKIDCSVDK